jgi:AAA family ATP:ADP antiporter
VGQLVRYIHTLTDQEDITLYKKLAVRAIGNSQLATYYSFIYELLEDPDLEVVNEAIRSAGQTMYPNFIPRLTRYLVGKQTRVAATEALLFYGVGVIEELRTIVLDPESNSEVIRKVPAVIKQIEAQRSVDVLLEFLNQPDVMLRLESLRALNTVQQEYPYLLIPKEEVIGHLYDEIHLYKEILGIFYQQQRQVDQEAGEELRSARSSLTELLERRMDGTVERIFRLLGLSYPPDDVIPVYNGIRSINPQERLDSVEFLDNLLEPSLKRALMPVAETFILESVSDKQIDQLKVELKREKDCLELLLQGRDPKLKLAVFHLISQLQDREYLPLILPLRTHPLPRIREQANELCKQMEALP